MSHILKVSRLEGLTDGIFAIAMTILALDMHLPASLVDMPHVYTLMPGIYFKLFIYGGSFIILGTLWIAMNFQLGILDHVNRPYLWCNVFYLMIICVVPFSSSFVAAYPNSPISLTFYAVNLLFTSIAQLLTCECARLYQLNGTRYSPAIRSAIIRRIFLAPPFYILSLLLAPFDTSLAFIALITPPLIYMIPGYVDKFEPGNH